MSTMIIQIQKMRCQSIRDRLTVMTDEKNTAANRVEGLDRVTVIVIEGVIIIRQAIVAIRTDIGTVTVIVAVRVVDDEAVAAAETGVSVEVVAAIVITIGLVAVGRAARPKLFSFHLGIKTLKTT